MSGGRATLAHAKGKRLAAQSGDLTCIHPIGQDFITRYFCECKHVLNLNLTGLLTGRGMLADFWRVACHEAVKYDKAPLLIAQQNRQPPIIGLAPSEAKYLGVAGISKLVVTQFDPYLTIILLEEFLQWAKMPAQINLPNQTRSSEPIS